MTRLTKRQRRAKAQHASRAKVFDSGFVATLLEVSHDPDYQPDRENEEASDGNSPAPGRLGLRLAFHSMPVSSTVGVEDEPENSNHYGSMEEYKSDVRKRRHSEEFKDTLAKSKEVLNHSMGSEASAYSSLFATVVSKSWMEIQVPVCLVNLNMLNVVCDTEQDKKPVISLPIRSMPTYTGAGHMLTYLHEQRLWETTKNNNKITAFFKPKPRAHPLSPPSPSPPEPIISILDSPSDPVASKTSAPSSDSDPSQSRHCTRRFRFQS